MSRYKFKSSGKLFTNNSINKNIDKDVFDNRKPIGILTPLSLPSDDRSTLFQQSFDLKDQVRDNLKNLLLTSPGERLGRYDFGVGLRSLTFEMISQNDDYDSLIMSMIKENVSIYMPFVSLKTLTSEKINIETSKENKSLAKLSLLVEYDIPRLSITNQKINLILYIAG